MAGNTQSSMEQPPAAAPASQREPATNENEITFSPHECSTQGGGQLLITFPQGVPSGSLFLIFSGSSQYHKQAAEKVDDHTVTAMLPAHEQPEVVNLMLYHLPTSAQDHTYQSSLLLQDKFVYMDPTCYMAELLLQSVVDTQAVPLLYSVLPPLATFSSEELRSFDESLTAALKKESLPEGWSVLGKKGEEGEESEGKGQGCSPSGDTLLHFASYSRLPNLFHYLISLPGGKEAIHVTNNEGLYPLDLAQRNGCQEIVQLITNSGCGDGCGHGENKRNHFRVDSPSEELRLLRSIDSDWIAQQRSSLLATDPVVPLPCVPGPLHLSLPPPLLPRRRKSITVVEDVTRDAGHAAAPLTGEGSSPVQQLDRVRRRNWSRVVGVSNSRSIDTGLNELHRISAELLLWEKMAVVRAELGLTHQQISTSSTASSSSTTTATTHANNSGRSSRGSELAFPSSKWMGRRSSSCPTLCDELSYQLIHSTLTSPALIGRFSDTPSVNEELEALEQPSPSSPPHMALHTSASNGESISPPYSAVPALCMEDMETRERFCVPVGLTPPNATRPHSADPISRNSSRQSDTKEAKPADSPTSIEGGKGEEQEEGVSGDSPVLTTKSAPNLLSISDEEEEEEDEEEGKEEGAVLITAHSSSGTSDHSPAELRRPSPLSSRSFSHRTDTPGKSLLPVIRKHKKSFSVSGVKIFRDVEGGGKEEEEDSGRLHGAMSVMSMGPEVESRSRGSSVLSTSSKTGSSASDGGMDDEEEDEEELEKDKDLKTPSNPRLPIVLDKVPPGEMGKGEKRLSASLVTNIDDYCASSDDNEEVTMRPSPFWEKCDSDTTPTNTLTLSTQRTSGRGRKGHGKRPTEEVDMGKSGDENADLTLSDIDVRVSSLNSSHSVGQLEQSMPGSLVSNGVPPGSNSPSHRRESCPDTSEPQLTSSPHPEPSLAPPAEQVPVRATLDAHATIKHLRELMQEDRGDSPTFLHNYTSDDSDKESTSKKIWKKKNQTLPSSSSGSFSPKSRNAGSFTLHTPPSKVTRNASSASDSIVYNSSTSTSQEDDVTSLDFSPHLPSDPSSPRMSPRAQRTGPDAHHPPSPLFISKSPQGQLPLTRSGEETKMEGSPLKNSIKVDRPASISPLEKRVSRSAENLLIEDLPARPTELERSVVVGDSERGLKHLRFKPVEEEGAQHHSTVVKGKKGKTDKMVERESSRRGGFSKLFRRDSKRSKPSKADSSSSLDAVLVGESQVAKEEEPAKKYQVLRGDKQGKSRPPDIKTNPVPSSPVSTKPRSATIHGDMNLPHSASLDLGQPLLPIDTLPVVSPLSDGSPAPTSPLNKPEAPQPELGEVEKAETSTVPLPDHYPELEVSVDEERRWYTTIDRRLRKNITKHEKARQGAIFDWIRTERHFLRSLLVMKLVFRDKLQTEVSEEVLEQLFPHLDQLISISRAFSDRLVERQRQSTIISDISDILLEQFTGFKGQEVLDNFSEFVCRQPTALELYKDLQKRKPRFVRFMNGLYMNRHCERRKLPDFYLLVAQRVAKYVEMMKKLVKETEAQGLDHLPRLQQSSMALADMVEAVDSAVYKYTNRKELEDIQARLEVSVSHSRKGWTRKELKRLDLLAQDRCLLKKGEAMWQGHGKQINVLIVLVTDCLVLLTERDQKLNIASLQDLKAPVIRLFDLHVRVNASVKSGVQLLLLEQGEHPEMFRLEFLTKKMAKEWEEALNKAVEYCRTKKLTCEYLGAEPMTSGDDEGRGEEEVDGEDRLEPLPSDISPITLRRMQMQDAMDQATRLLSKTMATDDPSASHRHFVAQPSVSFPSGASFPSARTKPSRSFTLYEQRRSSDQTETKKRPSKKLPDRGRTFQEKKDKEKGGATANSEMWERERQVLLDCVSKLKDSVEFLIEQSEKKDKQIEKLKQDITDLKEERHESRDSDGSPVLQQNSSRSSFSRPHSVHYDLLENPPDFSNISPRNSPSSRRSRLVVPVPNT